MTHGKTYNKSPRRINHKATKSKTNTGTIALERSVEQTTGGFKALLQLVNFTLGPFKIELQDGSPLGFLLEMILTVLNLKVAPILLSKFQVDWIFGSGEEVQNRFSRRRPSWISDSEF